MSSGKFIRVSQQEEEIRTVEAAPSFRNLFDFFRGTPKDVGDRLYNHVPNPGHYDPRLHGYAHYR